MGLSSTEQCRVGTVVGRCAPTVSAWALSTVILWKSRNYKPNVTASHPIWISLSTKPLWELQIQDLTSLWLRHTMDTAVCHQGDHTVLAEGSVCRFYLHAQLEVNGVLYELTAYWIPLSKSYTGNWSITWYVYYYEI